MGLLIATKAFFKLIANRELSQSFQRLLDGEKLTGSEEQPAPNPQITATPKPQKPTRSEAISLLAALQREARLIDIVKEPLGEYSDAQIGAAARDVLRDTGKVLDRMFELTPLTNAEDGSQLETPATFDSARFHLTGNVSGEAPYQGNVAHHGWEAKKCDVPKWTGKEASTQIIAPIELEIT